MRVKGGFTLIEVSLFLAITGALLLAVTVGVQNSIFQQRYNDSVQDFAEFLRRVYADTSNVQSVSNGRSEYAIYGELVTFGETMDLSYNTINSGTDAASTIFVYDVVGKVSNSSGNSSAKDALKSLGANVAVDDGSGVKLAGVAESYRPKWGAQIQDADGNPFKGALLIVRHPQSGTMATYVMQGKTVRVNEMMRVAGSNIPMVFGTGGSLLNDFKMQTVDFCVSPNDGTTGFRRMDVKIREGARNSLGVEVLDDSSDNPCRKE